MELDANLFKNVYRTRYEILTEVSLKIQVFWDDAVSFVKYLRTFLTHRNPLKGQ